MTKAFDTSRILNSHFKKKKKKITPLYFWTQGGCVLKALVWEIAYLTVNLTFNYFRCRTWGTKFRSEQRNNEPVFSCWYLITWLKGSRLVQSFQVEWATWCSVSFVWNSVIGRTSRRLKEGRDEWNVATFLCKNVLNVCGTYCAISPSGLHFLHRCAVKYFFKW